MVLLIVLLPIFALFFLCGAFLLQKATKLVAKFELSYKQNSRFVAISGAFGLLLQLIMSPLLKYMHSFSFSVLLAVLIPFVIQVIIYTKLIKNPETGGFISYSTASKIALIVFLVSGLVFAIIGLTFWYWLSSIGLINHLTMQFFLTNLYGIYY